MESKINKRQIQQIHAMLSSIGIMDQKPDLIMDVTGGRAESTSSMTYGEAVQLIGHLRSLQPQGGSKPRGGYREGNRIRRAIMSMAYTLEVINSKMTNAEKIAAIDDYVKGHPKTAKDFKPFIERSVKELQALHYQFERFLLHRLGGR